MTNFEHIKQLSTEDFFDFLATVNLDRCRCPADISVCSKCVCSNPCETAMIKWLNSEFESNDFLGW